MALKVEQNYVNGIPQTAVSGFAPRGLAWHWTAGGTGRAGAQRTIQHFINTRYTVNASYHILFWHEHRADLDCTTVAQWIVPATKASHSMNPAAAFKPKTGSALESARFAEVHRILARDSDPNADVWALSYCGMPADLARDLRCPTFVRDLQGLSKQLIAHPTFIVARPHFGHGWIQPTTRYEMDQVGVDFIKLMYNEVAIPSPEDKVFKPTNPIVTQDWDTVVGPASTFIRPDGTTGYFTSKERVTSVAEGSVGGADYRLLDYGPNHEALLIPRAGLTNAGTRYVGAKVVTVTKEVVKEVPTGITQTDVDNAVKAERERIAQAEATRIRST